MIRKFRLNPAWLILGLALLATEVGAQAKPDSLAFLKKQADSMVAILDRAVAQKDSSLLVSLFSDTVGILLPGDRRLVGRPSVAKYASLLFDRFGGGGLTTTRRGIEKVVGCKDLAREAGNFSLIREDSLGGGEMIEGKYSVYWRYTDTSWVIERLLVSRN